MTTITQTCQQQKIGNHEQNPSELLTQKVSLTNEILKNLENSCCEYSKLHQNITDFLHADCGKTFEDEKDFPIDTFTQNIFLIHRNCYLNQHQLEKHILSSSSITSSEFVSNASILMNQDFEFGADRPEFFAKKVDEGLTTEEATATEEKSASTIQNENNNYQFEGFDINDHSKPLEDVQASHIITFGSKTPPSNKKQRQRRKSTNSNKEINSFIDDGDSDENNNQDHLHQQEDDKTFTRKRKKSNSFHEHSSESSESEENEQPEDNDLNFLESSNNNDSLLLRSPQPLRTPPHVHFHLPSNHDDDDDEHFNLQPLHKKIRRSTTTEPLWSGPSDSFSGGKISAGKGKGKGKPSRKRIEELRQQGKQKEPENNDIDISEDEEENEENEEQMEGDHEILGENKEKMISLKDIYQVVDRNTTICLYHGTTHNMEDWKDWRFIQASDWDDVKKFLEEDKNACKRIDLDNLKSWSHKSKNKKQIEIYGIMCRNSKMKFYHWSKTAK